MSSQQKNLFSRPFCISNGQTGHAEECFCYSTLAVLLLHFGRFEFVRQISNPAPFLTLQHLERKDMFPNIPKKKQEKLLARRDADGYPGLIPLKEIYHFEDFLTHERDWHSAVTQGRELLHVYRHAGEEVIVWFKEKPRTTITTRHGMGLYYCYLTFSERKDIYHEQVDGI